MKTARAFLIMMYLHLVLSVATPVVVVVSGQYRELEQLGFVLFVAYMAELVLLPVLGFVTAGAGIRHCRRDEGEQLEKGWMLLKFGSVPFYLLNFLVCCVAMALVIGASRGLLIFLIPIPVGYTCLLIAQSGCLGACLVYLLRKREARPSPLHYVLQFLPLLDFVSGLVLLKKYGHTEEEADEEEEEYGYEYR